jgi:hypothetical protein
MKKIGHAVLNQKMIPICGVIGHVLWLHDFVLKCSSSTPMWYDKRHLKNQPFAVLPVTAGV